MLPYGWCNIRIIIQERFRLLFILHFNETLQKRDREKKIIYNIMYVHAVIPIQFKQCILYICTCIVYKYVLQAILTCVGSCGFLAFNRSTLLTRPNDSPKAINCKEKIVSTCITGIKSKNFKSTNQILFFLILQYIVVLL